MVKVIRKNLKQHDCGIVAAFNALSWCKKPQKYEVIEHIATYMFDYRPNAGITGINFGHLINHFGARAKFMKNVSVEEIQSTVQMGRGVLLTYRLTGDPIGHLVMVVLDKSGRIKTINAETRKPTWDDLASDIFAGGSDWFAAWELPNRNLL